jgi:flagellar motor switch protein FliM
MFGGDSRFHNPIDGRDFTATEQRIILRVFEVVQECYRAAWKPVHAVPFDYVRSETYPQFANVANATDLVIVTTLSIELGAGGGDIHICIPYCGIEAIRDLLHSPTRAETTTNDNRWTRLLTQQVQLADVDLVAELAHAEVTVRQILNMKAGDIVDLDLKPILTAAIDGVPVINCRYGVLNGKYAIKVEQVLSRTPPNTLESYATHTGEAHVH